MSRSAGKHNMSSSSRFAVPSVATRSTSNESAELEPLHLNNSDALGEDNYNDNGDNDNGAYNNNYSNARSRTYSAGEYERDRRKRRRNCALLLLAGIAVAAIGIKHNRNSGTIIFDIGGGGNSNSRNEYWGRWGSSWGSSKATLTETGFVRPPPRTSTYGYGRDHPRAFVCITGQLPRLELKNKIQNLFLPWHEQNNVEFDVALVLSDTAHASVRRSDRRRRDQAYFDMDEVYDELSSLGPWMHVLNKDVDTQAQHPILNPHYMRQRGRDSSMNSTQLLERVQNHVRQFESLSRCSYHMNAAGYGPSEYNIIHRVRDDSGYYRHVGFDHLYNLVTMYPMTIVSSDCEIHKGINDRGSFASPEAAYDYFNHPILNMYTKGIPEDVHNTEQFLMVTYGRTCRLVQTDWYHLFRLWDSNNTVSFSESDVKCIEKNHISNTDERAIHKRKKVCKELDDGNTYCVHLDQAGLTYEADESYYSSSGHSGGKDEEGTVWDRHSALQVGKAGGLVPQDREIGESSDEELDKLARRPEEDWTESSDSLDELPREKADPDPDTLGLDDLDDDVYKTLDSGDDVDKKQAKKIARKKKRMKEREDNEGVIAKAAGIGVEEEEEDLPDEMKLPDDRRLRRRIRRRSLSTQVIRMFNNIF